MSIRGDRSRGMRTILPIRFRLQIVLFLSGMVSSCQWKYISFVAQFPCWLSIERTLNPPLQPATKLLAGIPNRRYAGGQNEQTVGSRSIPSCTCGYWYIKGLLVSNGEFTNDCFSFFVAKIRSSILLSSLSIPTHHQWSISLSQLVLNIS
jgi:hypothetical protein